MAVKKPADESRNGNQTGDEDEGPRVKISITVPPELLDRLDAYRKRRGGLNRSAIFALAMDWFMDEHPLKQP
ncbi:CopG family ribbon-helix-helix protein [Paraburkholderia sp. 35.1]|uniref:CopG family ribbon-helix-helix protein n=1 Tax=Paraburkholderia sp. 35.1 TaxID=2991058 RepID=UPI003D217243